MRVGVSLLHVSHVLCELCCQATANGLNGYARKITQGKKVTHASMVAGISGKETMWLVSVCSLRVCVFVCVYNTEYTCVKSLVSNMCVFFYCLLATSWDTHWLFTRFIRMDLFISFYQCLEDAGGWSLNQFNMHVCGPCMWASRNLGWINCSVAYSSILVSLTVVDEALVKESHLEQQLHSRKTW